MTQLITHKGGCHCGAVRFEVEAPANIVLSECNCSICRMSGYLHLIVPRAAFHLIKGEDALATYRFNTGVAQHRFCKSCGVKSFYVPRSHPDGVSVNARCLDLETVLSTKISKFDGQNWERNIASLPPLRA